MSDCLGMCLQIMDSGVLIGTSACSVCVYLISGGQMVVTGSISKSGCALCLEVMMADQPGHPHPRPFHGMGEW